MTSENERLDDLEIPEPPELVDPIWERQPKETVRQFSAFLSYRDFTPPYARTLDTAWRQYRNIEDETRKAPGSYRNTAAEKQWTKRTAAYESEMSRQRRERWEREVDVVRERVYEQARGIGGHVSKRLNLLAERVQEGKEELPLNLLMSWWKQAIDAQFHVVGYVPPQKVEADVNLASGGVPVDFVIRPKLSEDELYTQAAEALGLVESDLTDEVEEEVVEGDADS